MSDSLEEEVRTQLAAVAEQLIGLCYLLGGLAATLPISPQERCEEDLVEPMDFAARARSAILCVLNDSLGPAIRDLKAAAAHPAEGRADPGS